jgi:hypothetical protein
MDILAFLAAVFELAGDLPGGRVTVKDRYEMKKKVRELRRRKRDDARRNAQTGGKARRS